MNIIPNRNISIELGRRSLTLQLLVESPRNPYSRKKRVKLVGVLPLMSLRSVPNSRDGGDGSDQGSFFCYDRNRCIRVYAPLVTLVSWTRLARFAGSLRLIFSSRLFQLLISTTIETRVKTAT